LLILVSSLGLSNLPLNNGKEAAQGDAEKQKQAGDILNATNELGRTQAVNFKLQVM